MFVLDRVLFAFQIMVNVMQARPRYDFSADYFVKIYRAECVCLRLHCNLIKSLLDKQVCLMGNYAIWSIEDILRISTFLHFVNKNIFVFTVINLVAVPACRVGHSGSYNKCFV